jgi:hypothetical protein
MLQRILLAVVVAVAAGLICLLVGIVLDALKVPPAVAVGGFLVAYCWVIGVLFGLWYFLKGGSLGIGGL